MAEKLSINSELFDKMRDQYDTMLNSIVKILETGDEGELTIKVGIDKRAVYEKTEEYEEEVEKQMINVSWDIARIIKAKKYQVKGRNMDEFFLQEDEDGKLQVNKIEQVSMFDGEGKKVVNMRRY